jgi:hypothetical protein
MDIAQLVIMLCSADTSQIRTAAEKLARLGTEAQAAALPLVKKCATADDETREWIVAALEDLGPPRSEDVAKLAELAVHPSLDTAYWAATLLGRLQAQAAPAVRALAAALGSHSEMAVRERAAWALAQIGPAANDARDPLQTAAASQNPRLATLAQEALAQLGR